MAKPMAESVTPSCEIAMQQPRNGRWRRYLGALLCIGVSGLFLYLAMRKADFLEVRNALGAMNLRWLLPMIAVGLVDFGCVPCDGLGCFQGIPGRQYVEHLVYL